MKAIILGPAYPFRGGIADTNEALCRALIRNGVEASIVTFSLQYPDFLFPGKTQYSSDPAPEGLRIDRWINSVNPLNWWVTARKINREKPDLVIIRFWLPFMGPCLGSIARLLSRNTKIIGVTDNAIPHEKRLGDMLFTKYFLGACHAFVTLSSSVLEELKTLTNKPMTYFPHPINDQWEEAIDKQTARAYLQLKPDARYLLFFGLVRKYKGLDLLLEALGEDVLKDQDVHLIVAGEFYDEKSRYLNIIEEKNLQDKVIIVDQFVPTAEVHYYFSAIDMVTQTYHSASQSGITQMAYHFNCPMLVTNVGGLSEMVPDKKVGYVVEKAPSAIAHAILDFYDNEREEGFRRGVMEEKKKYSWDRFVEKLLLL